MVASLRYYTSLSIHVVRDHAGVEPSAIGLRDVLLLHLQLRGGRLLKASLRGAVRRPSAAVCDRRPPATALCLLALQVFMP